jgi:hypothetical protein
MRKIWLCILVAALTLTSVEPAVAQDLASSIVGLWKITSHVRKEVESGATVNGQKPTGHVLYTKGGHFSYLWVSDTPTAPASGVLTNADRAILLNRTNGAGSGKYRVVEGKKIIFSYETAHNHLLTGASYTAEAEISGKTLTMTTAPFKSPRDNKMVTVVTTWERFEIPLSLLARADQVIE